MTCLGQDSPHKVSDTSQRGLGSQSLDKSQTWLKHDRQENQTISNGISDKHKTVPDMPQKSLATAEPQTQLRPSLLDPRCEHVPAVTRT